MESIPYPPANYLTLDCVHPFHQGRSLFYQYAMSAIRTSDTHSLIVDLDQTVTTSTEIYHLSVHLLIFYNVSSAISVSVVSISVSTSVSTTVSTYASISTLALTSVATSDTASTSVSTSSPVSSASMVPGVISSSSS